MQDLKPLRVFLEVAAQQSFAGAARSMGLTPATVTRLVAALEAELGQQLLVRTTRKVSLTSAGALVAARFQPALEALDAAQADLTRDTSPDRGRLAINVPVSFGQRVLPGILAAFRARYPEVMLDIRLTDTLIDIIETGCDLAIRISGPPNDKSTIWRKICEVPRYAVAAPGFFETRPETPEDLQQGTCLSYSATGSAETWTFTKAGLSRNVKASDAFVSNNGDLLCGLARAGAGVTVLPDFILQDGLDQGDLVPLLPDWTVTPLWLTLYYPPYEQLPPLVATFSQFFEAWVTDLASRD